MPPVLVREAYAHMKNISAAASSAMASGNKIVSVEANPAEYGGINLQGVSVNSASGSLPVKINVSSLSSADFAGFEFSIVEMNEINDADSFLKGSNVIYGGKQ